MHESSAPAAVIYKYRCIILYTSSRFFSIEKAGSARRSLRMLKKSLAEEWPLRIKVRPIRSDIEVFDKLDKIALRIDRVYRIYPLAHFNLLAAAEESHAMVL